MPENKNINQKGGRCEHSNTVRNQSWYQMKTLLADKSLYTAVAVVVAVVVIVFLLLLLLVVIVVVVVDIVTNPLP